MSVGLLEVTLQQCACERFSGQGSDIICGVCNVCLTRGDSARQIASTCKNPQIAHVYKMQIIFHMEFSGLCLSLQIVGLGIVGSFLQNCSTSI